MLQAGEYNVSVLWEALPLGVVGLRLRLPYWQNRNAVIGLSSLRFGERLC